MSQTRESATKVCGKKLRIDRWLKRHLQLEDLHGLQWVGRPEDGAFSINWSHKSAHGWSVAEKRNNIFLVYHLDRCGRAPRRYQDYKQLKQNLRCALRGSRYIKFEPALSSSRGCDARRVYRFLAEPRGDDSLFSDEPSSSFDEAPLLSLFNLDDQATDELPCLNVDTDLDLVPSVASCAGSADSADPQMEDELLLCDGGSQESWDLDFGGISELSAPVPTFSTVVFTVEGYDILNELFQDGFSPANFSVDLDES